MAEEGGGGGEGLMWGILILIIVLVVNVPVVSEVVFQWIPATVSVLTGRDIGVPDIGGIGAYVPEAGSEDSEQTEGTPAVELSVNDPQSGMGTTVDIESGDLGTTGIFTERITNIWHSILTPFLVFVSLLLFMGIVYAFIRTLQIRRQERATLMEIMKPVTSGSGNGAQLRWKKIVEHSNSDNENDWRLAILEADIILDEMLDVQGYSGETMADKMKKVEKSDFRTIDAAWDAHKIRNQIAHEGAHFPLNQREARRVIGLYESVFKEFHYI